MREKKKGSQVIWPKWGKLPHSISKMTLEIKTWCCFINSFNSLGSLMHLIEKQVVEKGSSKWIGKTESDARTSRRLEPRNAMKEPSRKWPSKKCDMTDTHTKIKYTYSGSDRKWFSSLITDLITAIFCHMKSITSVISSKTEADSGSYEYAHWLNRAEMTTTAANAIRRLFSWRL